MSLFNTLRKRVRIDREAVVHRNDLDLAGGVVLDWVVGAVVSLVHLLGPGTERQCQHLVAEAYAEDGDVRLEKVLNDRHGIFARRGRVARAVRQEDAVRLERQDFLGARLSRDDGDTAVQVGEEAEDVALDAVVESHDV